jgi:cell surface protein SprA
VNIKINRADYKFERFGLSTAFRVWGTILETKTHITYTIPFAHIPHSWVNTSAVYDSHYQWNAEHKWRRRVGNILQNDLSFTGIADFNMDSLIAKYFLKHDKPTI